MTEKNIEKDDKKTEQPVVTVTATKQEEEPKCKCNETEENCECDDETDTKKVDVEYEVYGNEVRDEAKKTVDGILSDIFSNLKSKQDEFNKTVGDIRANKPQFDVFTTDEELIVKVDLPRVKKDDVEVKVSTEAIEVDVNFPDDLKDYKDVKIIRRDRCYGETKLLIPLPEEVAINEVKATFEDAVLTVSIPKIRGRKVSVNIE